MAFRAEGFSDYSPSAFQPDESRAEQGARANATIGHASCYLTMNEKKQQSEDRHAARVAPARVVAHL